jgi:hypothetical protein
MGCGDTAAMHSNTRPLSAAALTDEFDADGERFPDRETAVDRKALEEDVAKRAWMGDSAQQLAGRIPTSVFALGDLAAAR